MPQLMGSNQKQKMEQPDAMGLLQSLLGQSTTQNMGKPGAWQQGAEKALKEKGDADLKEFIQQGGDPLEAQKKLASMSGQQQDPAALLASLLTMVGQSQQSPGQPAQQMQQQPSAAPQSQMQQSQMQQPQIQPGLLDSLFNKLPGGQMRQLNVQNQQLTNQGLQQTLSGQEPVQPTTKYSEDQAMKRQVQQQGADYQKAVDIESLKQASEMAKNGTLDANQLFQQYEKSAGTFNVIKDAYGRIEASIKDPSPAGDLSLIFGYMRLLDPASTVREGEFATAENAASIPTRIRQTYNKIISGQKLTKNQRDDFYKRAQILYKNSETQFTKTSSQFEKLARNNGVDPKMIMRDVGYVPEGQGQPQPQQKSSGFRVIGAR